MMAELEYTRYLARLGFSYDEITRLVRVKELYTQGAYHMLTPEGKRLAFIRWLYQQGKLSS